VVVVEELVLEGFFNAFDFSFVTFVLVSVLPPLGEDKVDTGVLVKEVEGMERVNPKRDPLLKPF